MIRYIQTVLIGMLFWTSALMPCVYAEVGAKTAALQSGGIVFERLDEAASTIWRLVRPSAGPIALNTSGEANGDLSPDLRINPLTRRPEVVWAYWTGSNYEIAWSFFDGETWSSPLLLTDSPADDIEPKLAFDHLGNLGIAWTRMESVSRIWYCEKDPEAGWSGEIVVSNGENPAKQASIAWDGLIPRISFHEDLSGGGARMIVAGGETPDPWPLAFLPELVAMSTWEGELDQGLDVTRGKVFTSWVDSASHLAFSRRVYGSWQVPEFEPYEGEDDIPRARIRIKSRVGSTP